jgi:formylglycine-generating enzyme required for sulfatase activity
VDLSQKSGLLYMTDVYEGPGLRGVPRGTVRKLRLVTYHFAYRGMGGQQNRVGLDGPWDIKRVLGTVPVEEDGSALFRVPANTPISIQPLDSEGKAIQLMRSWTTVMPGERQSCVGCHEPQNAVSPGKETIASRKAPSEIAPWYGPVRGFSFKREVQPVLDRYCSGCHSGKKRADGKALPDFTARPEVHPPSRNKGYSRGTKFTPSYMALRRYVRSPTIEPDMHVLAPYEFHADTAEFVQVLGKGHHGVKLPPEAWDRLVTWIDLHTPAHGTWHEFVNPGHVHRQRDRRREMMKRYAGRDEDPEAIYKPPGSPPRPVKPRKRPRVRAAKIVCPGWPFDAVEAKKRQGAAGPPTETVDLGGGVKLELVRIPAGEFVMGDEAGLPDERPRARVRIARPFRMGKLEVTNRQFALFDPRHDSRLEHVDFLHFNTKQRGHPLNTPDQPVVRVSWKRAMEFCRWLSEKTGRRFTLPTEAQWEWACRAGAATPLSWGKPEENFAGFANLADASYKKASSGIVYEWRPARASVNDRHRVSARIGSYKPNPWGLHDMHGNVAEWTRTTYRPYPYKDSDGRNNGSAKARKVARGGSFHDRPERSRSAFRRAYRPWQPVFNVGFRVVVEK